MSKAPSPSKPDATLHVPGALGLRGIAALSILVYHAWLYSSPEGPTSLPEPFETVAVYSRFGTAIFMLLSAFLLYLPFARAALIGGPQPPPRRFLQRRALRLLPAYWVILVVVSLLLGAALLRRGGQLELGSFADRPDLLITNLLLLQNFTPETFLTGIGPAWFVTTVIVFYLSLPLLGGVAGAIATRSASWRFRVLAVLAPAAALVVLGWSVKTLAVQFLSPPGWTPGWDADWSSVLVRSFLGQADRFGYGMAAAVVWAAISLRGIRLPSGWWIVPLGGGLLAGSLVVAVHKVGGINDLELESGLAFALALLVLVVALQPQLPARGRWAAHLLEGRAISSVGLISYSVFLWNEPIIRWMAAHGLTLPGAAGLPANLLLAGLIIIPLSIATYYLAERPVISTRPRAAAHGEVAAGQRW